jgi:hypothetical protein
LIQKLRRQADIEAVSVSLAGAPFARTRAQALLTEAHSRRKEIFGHAEFLAREYSQSSQDGKMCCLSNAAYGCETAYAPKIRRNGLGRRHCGRIAAMLLVSIGSPSALSHSTIEIIKHIAGNIIGKYSLIQATHVDELKSQWESLDAQARKCVILFSECPHSDLVEILSKTRAPILVTIDSFEGIVNHVMQARNMDFISSIRFASRVLCAIDLFRDSPNVMRVSARDCGKPLSIFVESLIQFYGATCTAEQFGMIMDGSMKNGSAQDIKLIDYMEARCPEARTTEQFLRQLPGDQRSVLISLAKDYNVILSGLPLTQVSWPTQLFFCADFHGKPLDGWVDLLGPGRGLIFGPYLHLTAGLWRATVELLVEDCFSENRISVDVYQPGVGSLPERIICIGIMKLPPEGFYCFDLDFEITDPFLPSELRFSLLTGAIEGRLSVVGVKLTWRKPANADFTAQQ